MILKILRIGKITIAVKIFKKLFIMLIKNNKLFDKETIDLLKQYVSEEKIISTQKEMMYDMILEKLENIYKLFKEKKFTKIREYLFFSPSGDDMGENNYCINFSNEIWETETDFMEVLEYLKNPNIIIKNEK
jgi:hypothetical protein